MPELPEVETVRRELAPQIIGSRIREVRLGWEGIVRLPSASEFQERVKGQPIKDIDRRGKYLIFKLEDTEMLIVHLKMTGSLIIRPDSEPTEKLDRAVIYLDNGLAVHFHDPRKFGRLWLTDDLKQVIKKMGPEPFGDGFTPEYFREGLKKRHAPIKPVILDQGFIAGIGNMYADESLFATRIHPLRPASSLSEREIRELYRAIKEILAAAIANRGASIRNYFRPDGTSGTAHFSFQVAHGIKDTCSRCGRPIKRLVVRGRGTYICSNCQRNRTAGIRRKV
jgi:formamidopyrimidine-DNA glycosylase